jgi:hypothetical protein
MELSPNYAGTLVGMTTTFANVAGFLGPLFVGEITNNNVITLFVFLIQLGRNSQNFFGKFVRFFVTLGLNILRLHIKAKSSF